MIFFEGNQSFTLLKGRGAATDTETPQAETDRNESLILATCSFGTCWNLGPRGHLNWVIVQVYYNSCGQLALAPAIQPSGCQGECLWCSGRSFWWADKIGSWKSWTTTIPGKWLPGVEATNTIYTAWRRLSTLHQKLRINAAHQLESLALHADSTWTSAQDAEWAVSRTYSHNTSQKNGHSPWRGGTFYIFYPLSTPISQQVLAIAQIEFSFSHWWRAEGIFLGPTCTCTHL